MLAAVELLYNWHLSETLDPVPALIHSLICASLLQTHPALWEVHQRGGGQAGPPAQTRETGGQHKQRIIQQYLYPHPKDRGVSWEEWHPWK